MDKGLSEQQKKEGSRPGATEDLTIAENLRVWRKEESGPDEEWYSEGGNPAFRVPSDESREFLEKFGPLHPGDY